MSHSLQGTPNAYNSPTNDIVLTGDDEVQPVLDALNDDDCRRILEAVTNADSFLSASEISDQCGVPLSTTYRKIDLLTEAALLEEHLRICRSGKHTSEYGRGVEDVRISVTEQAGIELELTGPKIGGALAD